MQNLKTTLKLLSRVLIALILFVGIKTLSAQDNSQNFKKIKIDGLAAVVGDFVILDSDIDKTLIDLQSQGVSTGNLDRCSLLGKLMEDSYTLTMQNKIALKLILNRFLIT